MASGQLSGIKRFLLWDYPRASWQYDVMVAIILAFIFLTPREFFRDQPRASDIVRLPAEHGTNVFWIDPAFLDAVPVEQRHVRVESELKRRFGRREPVVRLEPIPGDDREIKGYMAFTKQP
jgi:hypothetical protein